MCLCALLLLDNADAFAGYICIKLSRAQLLDMPELSKWPCRIPNKLCESSREDVPGSIENELNACSTVNMTEQVDHSGKTEMR